MESTLGTEWSKLQCDWGILLPHTKKGLMCWKEGSLNPEEGNGYLFPTPNPKRQQQPVDIKL